MARSSRGSSNRGRTSSTPAARQQAPAPVAPAPAPVAAPQASAGGGFLSGVAQIATGSVIGHGISNMLFGGRQHSDPAPQQQQQAPGMQQYADQSAQQVSACDPDQKAFMRCLEANPSNVSACQFYLDMLNQCKQSQTSLN